ncbi:hypothetical protein Tco_0421942 [Tanacetum coccineum]
MPKSNKEKKPASNLKCTVRISCCFNNPCLLSPPYQALSPPTNYQTAPTFISKCFSTALTNYNTENLTKQTLANPKIISTSIDLSSTSTLTINLDPMELIFSTHPTSPHVCFDSIEDLPPRTTNPPLPRPSFESIECLENQPPPLPSIKPPLPPLPPQLPPLPPQLPPIGPNNPFHIITHEMFCDHCQHTQVIVDNLHDEMRFIHNHILDRLNILDHNY